MERLRRVLDASWRRIGGVLGRLGASWGRLGRVLEASWGRLGGISDVLEAPRRRLAGVLEAKIARWPEKANLKPQHLNFTSIS